VLIKKTYRCRPTLNRGWFRLDRYFTIHLAASGTTLTLAPFANLSNPGVLCKAF
jgi:hypothetical protein